MVMSHLGLTPHTRAKLGGYRVQGKTAKKCRDSIRPKKTTRRRLFSVIVRGNSQQNQQV